MRRPRAPQRAPRRTARSASSASGSSAMLQRRWVFSGALGGMNSQVSGTPDFPSDPSDVPFSVNWVTPDDPVRTSTDRWPVNLRLLPLAITVPAAPTVGSSFPSTQTFTQARPPFAATTRFTPLYPTMTLRDKAAVLPPGPDAVTVIAHFPVVSSYGVLYVPSSPTFAVTDGGTGGGAGVALPPGAPDGPT